jgi:hypothetical protein
LLKIGNAFLLGGALSFRAKAAAIRRARAMEDVQGSGPELGRLLTIFQRAQCMIPFESVAVQVKSRWIANVRLLLF